MKTTNVEKLNKGQLNELAKRITRDGVELDRFVRSEGNGIVVGLFYEWDNEEYFIFMKNRGVRSIRKLNWNSVV